MHRFLRRTILYPSKYTSENSLHELSLYYAITLRAITYYYRIAEEKPDHAITIRLQNYETYTKCTDTCFLREARENIDYFENFSEKNLSNAPSNKITFAKFLK